jgi:uncharacterized protein YceK
MKKFLFMAVAVMLSGCSDLSSYTTVDSNASVKTKMKACMISEANTKFQAGTLLSQSISDTSDELVSTCAKKLALQSAGVSDEYQSTAQSIITNLQNFGSSN